MTRVLDKECSLFERDFVSDLKIFSKPLANALRVRKNLSNMKQKTLEEAHSLSKTRVNIGDRKLT